MSQKHDDLLALALPFDKSTESVMVKGGARLTYIPVSEVINRLNEVLSYNWSYTVQSCQRDPLDPDYIVAHVTMKVYMPNGQEPVSVRDGFGGVKVKRTKDGAIVDLGDEYKGAVSDALKKAAQAFGVGLYLARHEDTPSDNDTQPETTNNDRYTPQYPTAKRPFEGTKVIVNKLKGKCIHCGYEVEIGDGEAFNDGSGWKTRHVEGRCAPEEPF